jgi:outer membrane protein OmpA-like peptidoglycan-associated protein
VASPVSFIPGDPTLVASSPGARGEHLLRAALFADYARAPLVLISPSQTSQAVVEEQLWLRAAAAFAWRHRWLAALELPVLLRQQGEAQPLAGVASASNAMALGDLQLLLRGRLLGPADGFAFGAGLRGSLPLATEVYAGAKGPTLGAFVSAGHQNLASYSAFSLGFDWREAQTLPGILPTRLGSTVQLALGGGAALDGGRTTRLGPELAVMSVVGNGASFLDPRSTACQLLLHLRHRVLGGPLEVGAAFGPSLGRAPGAGDYRAILSFAFSPEEPVPPPDSDGDRVPDHSDMCPSLPGEQSEDPLMHGCPSVPSDADGDGIPDTLDACPRTPGEPSIERRRHGCPPAPPAPPVPEPAPTLAPEPKVRFQTEQITILEQVQFETGTAVLRPESVGLLEQVAELFRQRPEIESCEIAGHTDETGTPELNRQLSQARARSVMDWLVAHGVEAKRLTARGYGDTRPEADNATEAGRARNRRVEFVILRMAKPAGATP